MHSPHHMLTCSLTPLPLALSYKESLPFVVCGSSFCGMLITATPRRASGGDIYRARGFYSSYTAYLRVLACLACGSRWAAFLCAPPAVRGALSRCVRLLPSQHTFTYLLVFAWRLNPYITFLAIMGRHLSCCSDFRRARIRLVSPLLPCVRRACGGDA